MSDGYRCERCTGHVNRCKSCRARRAAAVRATRAAKRADGICLQCRRKAVAGQILCAVHRKMNNTLSAAAHAAARKLAPVVLALVALTVTACAADTTAPEGTPIPAGIAADIRAAWLGAGHLEPACALPTVLRVDFATFATECERPSCADPTVTPDTPVCAHACTRIGVDANVIMWAGEALPSSGRVIEATPVVWAHETYHAWRDCTYLSPDYYHLHSETWTDAMDRIRALEINP